MPYFIFNDVDSRNLGLIIKEMPPISKSEKDIEEIEILGKSGPLHIDYGTYRSKNYSIICILTDISKIDLLKKIYDGVGVLELSTEPNRTYNVAVKNQIDFSKYLEYLKEFPIEFSVAPIAYSKIEKVISLGPDETQSIEINGTAPPKFTCHTHLPGTFSINNDSVETLEPNLDIDCFLMNCTKNGLNANNKINLDKYPELKNGENIISTDESIDILEIHYKEGWL